MRAIRARYNPYLQAKHRLEQVHMYIQGAVELQIYVMTVCVYTTVCYLTVFIAYT